MANAIKKLTLKEWLLQLGVFDASRLMRTREATIYGWIHGRVLPRSDQMMLINKYSRGAVTYESMIEGHYSPKNKSRLSIKRDEALRA